MHYLLRVYGLGDVEIFGVTLPQNKDGMYPVLWQDGNIYHYWYPQNRFSAEDVVKEISESEIFAWRLKYGV